MQSPLWAGHGRCRAGLTNICAHLTRNQRVVRWGIRTGGQGLEALSPTACWEESKMSVPCKSERSLLSHEEYEIIRLTHHPAIYDVEAAELEAMRPRLRKMRDKERTLGRQKQREGRGKAEAQAPRASRTACAIFVACDTCPIVVPLTIFLRRVLGFGVIPSFAVAPAGGREMKFAARCSARAFRAASTCAVRVARL